MGSGRARAGRLKILEAAGSPAAAGALEAKPGAPALAAAALAY